MHITRRVTSALGMIALSWAFAAPMASAQGPTYPPTGPTTTQVEGTKVTQVPATPSSELPFTGAAIAAYTVTGAGLLTAGTVLSLAVRRRRSRSST